MAVFAKPGLGSIVVQEIKGHRGLSNADRSEESDGCSFICSVQYLVHDFLSGKTVIGDRQEDRERGTGITVVDVLSFVLARNIVLTRLGSPLVSGAGIVPILCWIPCSCFYRRL